MIEVLTEPSQATTAWLSTVLNERGFLRSGRVEDILLRRVGASSNVAFLSVQYSAGAEVVAPCNFVLKWTNAELEGRMPQRNRAEIALYQALAGQTDDLPIVPCFDAVYVAGRPDRFHLLLADPSATTHSAQRYSAVPPTLAQCRQIVQTLAFVHARFWKVAHLGDRLDWARAAELHSGALSAPFNEWVDATLPMFFADLGERLSPARSALYARIGRAAPARLVERQSSGRPLTLTQGDVHLGNFLYPRDASAHLPFIIDWKRAAVTVGANDLAYMMGLYWFPSVRERWERPLLRHYHQHLIEYGVVDYVWEDLWEDYRLAVLRQFFEAVWGWSVRQNSMIWWNHLERISLAIEDLECLDLL